MGAHLNTNTNITSTNIAHRILEDLLELNYIGYPYRVLRALAHSIPCSASAQIVRRTVRVWKASQPAANMSKHHRKEVCVCVLRFAPPLRLVGERELQMWELVFELQLLTWPSVGLAGWLMAG